MIIIWKASNSRGKVELLTKTLTNRRRLMKLYAGIDLHSNNSVLVIIDECDTKLYRELFLSRKYPRRNLLFRQQFPT